MKTVLIIFLSINALIGRTQSSYTSIMTTEHKNIIQTINRLFVATDNGNWEELNKIFDKSVRLDYSSMTNQPGATVTPQEIIASWKSILPGFEHTHHQIGNHLIEINDDTAHGFCYGTATHFLTNESGDTWMVVGSYDFDLRKENEHWMITSMRFNFKYQTGNSSLAGIAIERQKSK